MTASAGRRLLWPAVSTALMLVVLCGLGAWQVRRLHWKTALLARIAEAEQAPGVPLPASPAPFEKVHVIGRLGARIGRYGAEVRQTPGGEKLGSQVVAVLDRADGAPVVTLLGWLPDDAVFAVPAAPVSLDAYVRPPVHPGLFSPADDVARGKFYTLDPAVIGPALGAAAVAPFSLARMGPADPAGGPEPAATMPRPPNDHLQYAITWFGLALTLLVIFAAYARKVLRS